MCEEGEVELRFDWLELRKRSQSDDAEIIANPVGDRLYAVWSQEDFGKKGVVLAAEGGCPQDRSPRVTPEDILEDGTACGGPAGQNCYAVTGFAALHVVGMRFGGQWTGGDYTGCAANQDCIRGQFVREVTLSEGIDDDPGRVIQEAIHQRARRP